MHIQRIKIVRFKSFEEVTFDFNPKVNLLTGVNNAGKTTVLEAVALWHECYTKLVGMAGKAVKGKYQAKEYKLGDTTADYVPYQEIISVRSPHYEDIFYNLNTDPEQFVLLCATLADDEGRSLSIDFSIRAANGQNYLIKHSNYQDFDFRLFNDRTFLNDPLSSIQLAYASPVAFLSPTEEKHLPAKVRYLKQSRSSVAVLRNRLEMLRNRQNGDLESLWDDLSGVLNDRRSQVEMKFVSNDLYSKVSIRVGGEPYKDISLLGSGTLQVIEILLSFYEDKRDLNIILLDEPDSHLHHAIQRRLLQTLSKFSVNSQIFLTSHNEALIRAAEPEWVFHLEAQPTAHYHPIVQSPLPGIKKGLQPNAVSPVVRDLTGSNSLDFVHALEADKLLLVEGEDDAARFQKLLSLKINGSTRYAFWAMRGVDAVFSQIGMVRDIFSIIRNRQTLWEKAVLIMDKDDMTDEHRSRLMQGFSQKVGIKTIVWPSYNFESTLLSDLDKLAGLLRVYVEKNNPNAAALSTEAVRSALQREAATALEELKLLYTNEHELNSIYGCLVSRRQRLASKDLKVEVSDVFEVDRDLKIKLKAYYESCFNIENMHKICRKPHFEQILNSVLAQWGMDFNIESDFDPLFQNVNTTLWWGAWDSILAL
jgi:ABC-type cobalamin/Fe3+-siderophores transport system ATPase subunit